MRPECEQVSVQCAQCHDSGRDKGTEEDLTPRKLSCTVAPTTRSLAPSDAVFLPRGQQFRNAQPCFQGLAPKPSLSAPSVLTARFPKMLK